MGDKSKIQWTDATWNPVRGCTKVSPGCANCYAETFSERFRGVKGHPYEQGFDLRLVPENLYTPLKWARHRTIFVNSMSDLFHEGVPFEYIDQVFAVMALSVHHRFQVLTKRHDRLLEYLSVHRDKPFSECPEARVGRAALKIASDEFHENVNAPNWDAFWDWPLPNVWIGVSVENQHFADLRIPVLRQVPAAVRFLSVEPMLGPVDFTCDTEIGRLCQLTPHESDGDVTPGIDWVIVGGESGGLSAARPFDIAWARSIVKQCRIAGVPVFVKQLGTQPVNAVLGPVNPVNLRTVGEITDKKGGDMAEWPEDLRVREFPTVAA